MNEFLDAELYLSRTTPAADRETRHRAHRAALLVARRRARRHRLAERVRSVADLLES